MASPLITSAFARIGDTRNPPQTDPTGAVNWDNGYTPNYEIDLASGDPLAKAVERDVMNYLFNVLTDNTRQYQKLGFPEWYSSMPGGYQAGAFVAVENGVGYDIYRSLANNNTSNPVGNSTWDVVWTSAQLRNIIPMPLGGQNYITGGILSAGADVKTLTDGTYIVPSDTVAGQISNMAVPKAGVLEIKKYTSAGVPATMVRYYSTDNQSYWACFGSTSPGTWNRVISLSEIGNTVGLIPRIGTSGILINSSAANKFGFRAAAGVDGRSAEIFANSAAPVGDYATSMEQNFGGSTLSMGIRSASANLSGDAVIQYGGIDKVLIDKSGSGRILLKTADLRIAGNGSKFTFSDSSENEYGNIAAGNSSVNVRQISINVGSAKFTVNENDGVSFNGKISATNIFASSGIYIGAQNSGLQIGSGGAVNLVSNGTIVGGWASNSTDGSSFTVQGPIFSTNRFSATIIAGAGPFVSQYDSGAPFYSQGTSIPNASTNYYPAVKGKVITQSAGGAAYSFGYVMSGVVGIRGYMVVQYIDNDGTQVNWRFNAHNGDFTSPGKVIGGNIETSGSVTATGNIVASGSIAGNGVSSTDSITAATTIFAGNGSARFQANGNIAGSIWGSKSLADVVDARLIRDGATTGGFAGGNINAPYLRHEGTNTVVTLQRANALQPTIPGWFKDATGMIIQWGRVDANDNAATPFTFPIAFPNYILNLTCSVLRGQIAPDNLAMLSAWAGWNTLAGATGGNIIFASNYNPIGSGQVCWLAIGY